MNKNAKKDLLDSAWGIIANAYGGDWSKADPIWQAAANQWRNNYVKIPGKTKSKDPLPTN